MRKIIQIIDIPEQSNSQGWITALCNDGTIWYYSSGKWTPIKEQIPQGEIDEQL